MVILILIQQFYKDIQMRLSIMKFINMFLLSSLLTISSHAKSDYLNNPLATNDQRKLDELAIDIYNHYSFDKLRKEARDAYKIAYGEPLSDEAQSLIEPMINELVFSSIQKSVNNDPYYPKVYWVDAGARQWFGLDVPGGRYSYDNPDTIYRTIPIDGNLRYIIHGKRYGNGTLDYTFSLIDNPNSQNTIAILSKNDLIIHSDGTYTISIDNKPANGRINHIQSNRKAKQLFIRHTLGNWQSNIPDSLSVELLDSNKGHLPQDKSVIIQNAQLNLQESLLGYGIGALGLKTKIHPVNTLTEPSQSKWLGTLVTQASSFGHFNLDEDHALVLTIDQGAAQYFVVPVTGPWTITSTPDSCQCSLNNQQAIANSDGKYRFVISTKDPGIYNWVSSCGLHEGTMMIRWQNLATNFFFTKKPTISTEVILMTDLANKLPSDTAWVTADQRNEMITQRIAGYSKRVFDF